MVRPHILPTILFLAFLVPLAAVPHAAAALPPCWNSADVTIGDTHIVESGLHSEIWLEENDIPGLQVTECRSGGATHGPDHHAATILPSEGIVGLCTFFPVTVCV